MTKNNTVKSSTNLCQNKFCIWSEKKSLSVSGKYCPTATLRIMHKWKPQTWYTCALSFGVICIGRTAQINFGIFLGWSYPIPDCHTSRMLQHKLLKWKWKPWFKFSIRINENLTIGLGHKTSAGVSPSSDDPYRFSPNQWTSRLSTQCTSIWQTWAGLHCLPGKNKI